MHPYEMQAKMRERGHERAVRIKPASIYDTVERLQRLGYVEAVETSREGRRPERTVYRITEPGLDELAAWMQEIVSVPPSEYPPFGVALMFIGALQHKELAIEMLQRRAIRLEAELASYDAMMRGVLEHNIPRLFGIEDEYMQAMRRAELKWVRDIVKELQEGTLDWPQIPPLEERQHVK